jgi:transposase
VDLLTRGIHSSRRLEREAERNVELMWLTGRSAPDFNDLPEYSVIEGLMRVFIETV